jgi:signal transduction histidine kinase
MDEKLLRHIINNLISNAIKYSPEGDRVIFELICQSEEATFRVQDFGIGIPIEEQDRLFDSFHRGANVGSIPGTGLGLPIVKRAVDLHGGTILVESKVGVGTIFTVVLPDLAPK